MNYDSHLSKVLYMVFLQFPHFLKIIIESVRFMYILTTQT
jgi:hypothetical protein